MSDTDVAHLREVIREKREHIARQAAEIARLRAALAAMARLFEYEAAVRAERDAENARLRKLVVPCDNCGADYAQTGVEAGCPCRLHSEIDRLRRALEWMVGLTIWPDGPGFMPASMSHMKAYAAATAMQAAANAALRGEEGT